MKRLSIEAREAIVQKAFNRDNQSLRNLAKSNNIGYSTLHKWLSACRNGEQKNKNNGVTPKLHQAERFQHLMATSTLDESGLGIYCRQHGLYSFQLKQWKKEFMSKENDQKSPQAGKELKTLRAENKRLKKELRRKDSALAETTALLILKKKANLIWGMDEDAS
jgi:transposase-like protein